MLPLLEQFNFLPAQYILPLFAHCTLTTTYL